MPSLPLDAAQALGERILTRHDVGPENAAVTVRALLRAEMEGIPSHGFSRLPSYAAQAASGKVDGHAVPRVERPRPGTVLADARCGFAFRALADGLPVAARAAREQGAALLAVRNSHHAGVLGFPVGDLAREGLLALGFANTPGALAPHGGSRVTFGTNPLALGCPRAAGPPLVIDLSMGVMARGKIMLAARAGEPIPEGVAVDAQGQPTRDAARALDGALLPFGGPKGSALALLVEIMAAALTGASLAFELEPLTLFSPDGPAPRLGQSFLVLDPAASAGEGFARRVETLLAQVADQPGARLPGDRRTDLRRAAREAGAIDLPATLHAQLLDLC